MEKNNAKWDLIIKPESGFFHFDLKVLYSYRDLVRMLVKRDFVTFYKQTILGPLWFFIQPIFHAAINFFVFGKLAGLGPEGVPGYLFYLSGPIFWQYFQDVFGKVSGTFRDNQSIFGKVYFPRLVIPLSVLFSSLIKLGVQLILLLIAISFYFFQTGNVSIQQEIIFFPFFLLLLIGLSLGLGLIVTSLTAKYKDLKFVIDFGIPLLKYITPGIATTYLIFLSNVPSSEFLLMINPIGHILDSMNFIFTGAGAINYVNLLYSLVFMIVVLFFGVLIFQRTERNFIDTV